MRRHTTSHRTRTVPSLLLLAGLVALLPPTAMGAQMRGPEAVSVGGRVRVLLDSGDEVRGKLVWLDEAGLVLEAHRELPAADVDRVWMRHDRTRSFATGGAIGGGIVTGGLLALFVAGICESDSCSSDAAAAALVGAGIGALGGAVVGALVGAIASSWEEIDPGFRSERPDSSWALDIAVAPTLGESGAGLSLGMSLSLPDPR